MTIEKSALDKLGIHELRDLARQVGVHLPTTYKREDLYKEIEAILSGEKEPYKKKNNQGRPPKVVRNADITEILLPNVKDDFIIDNNVSENLCFNANSAVLANTTETDFVGYVKLLDNYGIVKTKTFDVVYLTYAIISRYDLRSGDYVFGFSKESTDKRNIATDILKINNVTVNNFVRPVVELTNNKRLVNVLGNEVVIGGTSLIKTNTNALDIATSLSKEYSVILLNINSKDANFNYKQENVTIVNVNFNMSDKDIYEISDLTFDIAKTQANQGKELVLVVNSLTALIKAHNISLTGNFSVDTIKSEVIKNVKNIMIKPYVANNSSYTIIDVENKNLQRNLNEVLTYELNDFFDKVND